MSAPVASGQVLAGKYRVDRVLGEGGMGVVVAATDEALERRVAIKFLLPQYAEHSEAATRFMREARAAVRIQSEHIARVIDVSTMEDGSPYMVMEYLEGSDLAGVIDKQGPLPVELAVSYVLQAADAIAEAHSYGIVHRDLKPANLFLAKQSDGSSKVKVLDFGISKNTIAAADGTDPSLTRTSSMMGSPLYMSPEQMRSSKDVDARTDIWALGVILYELLTARIPFDASSIPELSAKILLDEPDPLDRSDVDPELELTLMRSLAKDPNRRFPTIAEFCIALAPFAPRRARATVERISNLMISAGMSTSTLDSSESLAPARGYRSGLDATAITGGGPAPASATTGVSSASGETTGGQRPHAGTLGEWGKTNGPAVETKPKRDGRWLGVALAVLVLGGGAAAFVMSSGGEAPSSALSAAGSGVALSDPGAAETPEETKSPEEAANDEAQEREADNEAAVASGVALTNAAPTVTAAAADPPSEASPPAPAESVAARPAPKPVRPTPKPVPAKPAPQPPQTKKKGSQSLKDQFGGRK